MYHQSTWRTDTNWDKLKLSNNMKKFLKSKIRDEKSIEVGQNTIKALINRNLIDKNKNLTDIGYIKGLELLPLIEQCEFLNIELETIHIHVKDKPEMAALEFHNNIGHLGCFTEGGIVNIILNSLCLGVFFDLGQTIGIPFSHCTDISNIKAHFYSSIAAYGYFIDRVPNLEKLMFESISNTPKWEMLENFQILQSWQMNDTWFPHHFIGLDSKIIDLTYSSLGSQKLEKVMKLLFEDFYAFIKGWPDLTIIIDGEAKFIEVKVKDKLHRSQLITLSALKKYVNLDISVLKIIPE